MWDAAALWLRMYITHMYICCIDICTKGCAYLYEVMRICMYMYIYIHGRVYTYIHKDTCAEKGDIIRYANE